jgi:DNA-directed RNA polymerase subunit RPC12/RpoP
MQTRRRYRNRCLACGQESPQLGILIHVWTSRGYRRVGYVCQTCWTDLRQMFPWLRCELSR